MLENGDEYHLSSARFVGRLLSQSTPDSMIILV